MTDILHRARGRLATLEYRHHSWDSASSSTAVNRKHQMFPIRRTFLLIVTFDAIFMGLLWIIYNQILNITIDQAFQIEVLHYTIKTSLFDVVALSGVRFILLMIPYALLRWSHWIFVAFTTLGSTAFILAKTCVFTIVRTDRGLTDYIILIVSFVLAWVEIWFFDHRLIPHERRLRDALINHEQRRSLLSAYGSGSISPVPFFSNHSSVTLPNEHQQSFYSPRQSLDGSDFDDSKPTTLFRSGFNGLPSAVETDEDREAYEQQANEMTDELWRLYQDREGWAEEARSQDGKDTVNSKTFPNRGKVFRITSTVTGSRTEIIRMLFERQEEMPKWTAAVNECRILEVINDDLYITYQSTNEQAQGLVSKRDFINLTTRRMIDGVTLLVAQACLYPQLPPIDNCVRAENGLTAYIIEKIDNTSSKVIWILNVDLKGWLPQYLINSSLASVQLAFIASLRNYLSNSSEEIA